MADDPLEKRVQDLAVGVVGLSGAMREVGRALRADVDELREEITTQRMLAKYSRRTWFEVMAYIFLAGLLVSDLARDFCIVFPGSGAAAYPRACNVVFWTTEHGGGPQWRVLGLVLTVLFLFYMGHRAQVPADLYSKGVALPGARPSWYYRYLRKGRRS